MHRPLLVVDHPSGLEHDTGPGHPERAPRLQAAELAWSDPALETRIVRRVAGPASAEDLLRVHSTRHVESLRELATAGGGRIDADTVTSAGSWDAGLHAAGAGITAVEGVDGGDADAAFVVVRPPGHHATPDRAMGFCLFNNIAVTARWLTAQGQRVAVIDWDVHHGNGTQDAFWDDPDVLFVSLHQAGIYPGSGRHDERGGAGAPWSTLNLPLPARATGDVYRRAFDGVIRRAVEWHRPDWILVSAGYDAHRADPLADMALTDDDFASLTTRVMEMTGGTKVVFFLEGGYDLRALTDSVRATAAAALDRPTDSELATSRGGPGNEVVDILAGQWEQLGR